MTCFKAAFELLGLIIGRISGLFVVILNVAHGVSKNHEGRGDGPAGESKSHSTPKCSSHLQCLLGVQTALVGETRQYGLASGITFIKHSNGFIYVVHVKILFVIGCKVPDRTVMDHWGRCAIISVFLVCEQFVSHIGLRSCCTVTLAKEVRMFDDLWFTSLLCKTGGVRGAVFCRKEPLRSFCTNLPKPLSSKGLAGPPVDFFGSLEVSTGVEHNDHVFFVLILEKRDDAPSRQVGVTGLGTGHGEFAAEEFVIGDKDVLSRLGIAGEYRVAFHPGYLAYEGIVKRALSDYGNVFG